MQNSTQHTRALRFAAKWSGLPTADVRIEQHALRGGLEARSVRFVVARSSHGHELHRFVVKELVGATRREACIYRALTASAARTLAPRLLGLEERAGVATLYLELVASGPPWPWCELQHTRQVLCRLATLHTADVPEIEAALRCDWDYERELLDRGAALLALVEGSRRALREQGLIVPLPRLERVVEGLPALRRAILGSPRAPASLIHGDVHTGNVGLRQAPGDLAPVFLDWGRARLGNPFEDVSSWLQSLAFWEPLARRRHDTLLAAYFEARGWRWPASPELRRLYWLSAASNCLAGSLRYHVLRALDRHTPARQRALAIAAVRDQLRIMRRAEAYA